MHEERSFLVFEGVEVPESALLKRTGHNKYGSVPGLGDSELADPRELERQVWQREFAPVLALPVQVRKRSINRNLNGAGHIDWGAFGTVDFGRSMPEFDKMRYKAEQLQQQRKDVLIIFSIVNERLPRPAKYLVLKYLRMGIITLEQIVDEDMAALGRLYLRVQNLTKEIAAVHEARRQRLDRQAEAFVESL